MRLFFCLSFLLLGLNTLAQEKNYSVALINTELTQNANAVYRLDAIDINVKSTRDMSSSIVQVVTVLNENGNRHARTVIGYDKEKKIEDLHLYYFDSNGNEIAHFKRKDFEDVSANDGFSLYIDDKILSYRYTPIAYPYTMKISYTVRTSDTGIFPPWNFIPGYNASIEESRYSVTYADESLKPVIKEFNLSDFEFTKKADHRSITYSATQIEAIRSERQSPSFGTFAPRLSGRLKKFHFKGHDATVNNWEDLGRWMNSNLLKGRSDLPEETKTHVKTLVKNVDDELEKAKIIYKYVQDNTRYISVQVGIGGFQPINAIEVDNVKYGDCKGLSNYTKALLEVVGVNAYYTHVQAGRTKVDFEEDFADLAQGNHAILAIPYQDTYYWIDCTSQILPFGFIGDFTDDRKVFVIKPDGGEITTTTSYLDKDNHQKTEATFSLSEEGAISADVSIATQGIQYDNRFYLENKTGEDIEKHYKNYWDNINNLKVQEYRFENDREAIVFKEKIKVSASDYTTKSGDRVLFAVNAFNKNEYVPKRYRNRKMPLEIQRGYLDEDEFTIQLPKTYAIEALPAEKTVETEFGSYSMSLAISESKDAVNYRRKLFIKKGVYPKDKYKEYRNFMREVTASDNAKIVLIKKAQ